MDNLISIICVYGLWVLLFLLIYFAFIIWIIKKGVKNAINETLCSKEFREQLRNDITFAIISAHRQENSINLENSIDE